MGEYRTLDDILKDVRRRTAELGVPAMISINDGMLEAVQYDTWDTWMNSINNRMKLDTLKKNITVLLWDNKHDASYIDNIMK